MTIENSWMIMPEDDASWREQARCRTDPKVSTDDFFPERGEVRPASVTACCSRCPVREACLDFALTYRVKHGFWGGTTPRERRRLAKDHPKRASVQHAHGTYNRYRAGCRCHWCRRANAEARRRYG